MTSGAFVGYAAAGESDAWFEQFFFDDATKWLVGVPMLVVVVTETWRPSKCDRREDSADARLAV